MATVPSNLVIEDGVDVFDQSWAVDDLTTAFSEERVRGDIKKLSEIPPRGKLREVSLFAKAAGFKVERVVEGKQNGETRLSRNVLCVNGKLCMALWTRAESYPSKANLNGYSKIYLYSPRLTICHSVLALQAVYDYPRKVFVIPVADIKSKVIQLPLVKTNRKNSCVYWK